MSISVIRGARRDGPRALADPRGAELSAQLQSPKAYRERL
jgi:hypothetical protein